MSLTQGFFPPQIFLSSDFSLLYQSSGFCLFIKKKFLRTKPLASLLRAAPSSQGSLLLSVPLQLRMKWEVGRETGGLAGHGIV